MAKMPYLRTASNFDIFVYAATFMGKETRLIHRTSVIFLGMALKGMLMNLPAASCRVSGVEEPLLRQRRVSPCSKLQGIAKLKTKKRQLFEVLLW
jgi:hypothetical protein